MPLRVLIVDDEPLALQELQYLLEDAGEVEVVGVGRNGIEAVELIRAHRPELVFLDVQMPGLDGFGVLKKLLEERTPLPQVVFATAYDQYAVRAFEVNAIDYLLKPFDGGRVARALDKARARMPAAEPSGAGSATAAKLDALLRLVEEATQAATQTANQATAQATAPAAGPATAHAPKNGPGRVVVRAQNRLLLVDQKEICFAAIEEGAISVTTSTVEGQSNCRTLEELMDQLDPGLFWRVHRSFLVNIQHIREVVPWFKSSYQLRMDDRRNTEIPVSRNQTRRLRDLFNL